MEIAMNLRCAWNHGADELWRRLDVAAYKHHAIDETRLPHRTFAQLTVGERIAALQVVEQTARAEHIRSGQASAHLRPLHDGVSILPPIQMAAPAKIVAALADPSFCALLSRVLADKRAYESGPGWFQQTHPRAQLTCVAYFCLEFMLSEALPIYSGGLGNVAGDQLKAASDLGVPVVAVGLLYQRGSLHQVIDSDGAQQAICMWNDPTRMPVARVRDADGELLRLELQLPGGAVWLRAWAVKVGRLTLYLLDTDDAANDPAHRSITSELYGGGHELRLQQELVLGVGGWRLLAALGLKPDVCHLNEGHAAFALLERAHDFMRETGQPFAVAHAATRAGNLFTTHTAVAAGFDRFPPGLMERYFVHYARDKLGLTMRSFMALGRVNGDDDAEPFNMAYLAMRGSLAINGVSRLHGRVSRRVFAPLFPRWPEHEVPISHVTNGVHMPTWDTAAADQLWTDACGKERWLGKSTVELANAVRRVPDEAIWAMRAANRASLVGYARHHVARQMTANGAEALVIAPVLERLDPAVLTLGFARRFAHYKRPDLLLHDPPRLVRLLNDQKRPVQLILAGKAHPADQVGQALIRKWLQFIGELGVTSQVFFLSDYDMLLAEQLVGGVDVWINTPLRPWEASGTSGMKVLVNGGLNLSQLDGWWDEAYEPDVGWAVGDRREHGDAAARDAADADALYTLLEREVIPEFYARNDDGLPVVWLARVRASMAKLTSQYCASRAVAEYTEQHYLPAALEYKRRAANSGAAARRLVDWRTAFADRWAALHFGRLIVTAQPHDNDNGGAPHPHVISVEVFLHDASPDTVRVELYADGGDPDGRASGCQRMSRLGALLGEVSGGFLYARRSSLCRLYRPHDGAVWRRQRWHGDAAGSKLDQVAEVNVKSSCRIFCLSMLPERPRFVPLGRALANMTHSRRQTRGTARLSADRRRVRRRRRSTRADWRVCRRRRPCASADRRPRDPTCETDRRQ
jgi:starch phosphorylase